MDKITKNVIKILETIFWLWAIIVITQGYINDNLKDVILGIFFTIIVLAFELTKTESKLNEHIKEGSK